MSNFGFVEFETGDVSAESGWLGGAQVTAANVQDVEAACRGLDGKDFMGERYDALSEGYGHHLPNRLIVERARDSRRRDTWDP